MMISVVIPTYERPSFLEGAIKTVLKQTHDNIEIIVVDDGSSESYAEEVTSKYRGIVTCVEHDENKGLSAARNTGIRESSGEYIAFLDDDDRWHRTKLSRQIEALETDDQAGLATCLVAAVAPDGELIHCEQSAPSGDCSDEILIGNHIGTPSRVVVRRECFNDIGMFDESLQTKQDWDFYLRLCQGWNVIAVEDHLCFRTVHDSMSSSPESAQRDNEKIIEKHESLLQSRGLFSETKAEIAERVGRAYLKNGNLIKARKKFWDSISKCQTLKRILLYLITFTHPVLIDTARKAKRRRSISRSGCSKPDSSKTVH